MSYVLGIDIGGTKTAAAVTTPVGDVVGFTQLPTPAREGPAAVVETAIRCARTALAAAPAPVTACGIGTAGTVGRDGEIVYATAALPDWAGTDLPTLVGSALELPVQVRNDVHATALGESRFGAAAGYRHALVVAVGTGIGSGFTHDGQLVTGASGSAGALGHLTVTHDGAPRRCSCGRWGHVEGYAAGPAIELQHAEATGTALALPAIAALARDGDATASRIVALAGELLGQAIGQACVLLDPGVVVLTGGVAALGDLIEVPLTRAVAAAVLPGLPVPELRFSRLGIHAVILGAAAVARDALAPAHT